MVKGRRTGDPITSRATRLRTQRPQWRLLVSWDEMSLKDFRTLFWGQTLQVKNEMLYCVKYCCNCIKTHKDQNNGFWARQREERLWGVTWQGRSGETPQSPAPKEVPFWPWRNSWGKHWAASTAQSQYDSWLQLSFENSPRQQESDFVFSMKEFLKSKQTTITTSNRKTGWMQLTLEIPIWFNIESGNSRDVGCL